MAGNMNYRSFGKCISKETQTTPWRIVGLVQGPQSHCTCMETKAEGSLNSPSWFSAYSRWLAGGVQNTRTQVGILTFVGALHIPNMSQLFKARSKHETLCSSQFWQSRHSMCTRFLYAVLPSELYWGDKSLVHLNSYLAMNLRKLFDEGISWYFSS